MTRRLDWLLEARGSPVVYALKAWPLASVPALALIVGAVLARSALGLDPEIGPTRGYPNPWRGSYWASCCSRLWSRPWP